MGRIMDIRYLRDLLEQVQSGCMNLDAVIDELKKLPFQDLGYAKIDNHRSIRKGVPEVIFCQAKTIDQIKGIVKGMSKNHQNIMATRASHEVFEGIQKVAECQYYKEARIVVVNPLFVEKVGHVAVVTAGTCDMPVAEEAAVTAEVLGNRVIRIYDVGVAGIHRLLDATSDLLHAHVAVVVAGMEGVLPVSWEGWWPVPSLGFPPASAMVPASGASPPCSPCSIAVPLGYQWSISTMALGQAIRPVSSISWA